MLAGHSRSGSAIGRKIPTRSGYVAYRVRKYIGAYIAAMGGASAVIFGGGIGENTPEVRRRICANLRCLGLDFDDALNREIVNRESRITRPDSGLEVWVIPTEEGLMIAREAVQWHSRQP